MDKVGVRALKQNASAVVAEAAAGEVVTITDRGRAVAQLGPLLAGRLAILLAGGRARPPKHSLSQLGRSPRRRAGRPPLSVVLTTMRDEEEG